MKEIKLTQGKVALVDDEDFQKVNQFKWCISKEYRGSGICYAHRYMGKKNGRQITMSLHRFILNAPPKIQIDHINRNGLDNRKCNLRMCNHSQNQANTGLNKNNKTGYRGVIYYPKCIFNPWMATIQYKKKIYYLGNFATAEEASKAYNKARKRFHGEFAYSNLKEIK